MIFAAKNINGVGGMLKSLQRFTKQISQKLARSRIHHTQ